MVVKAAPEPMIQRELLLLNGLGQGDRAEEGFGFVDGFDVFVGGVGIGDDSGAGLDVGFAVFQQAGAEGDAGIV